MSSLTKRIICVFLALMLILSAVPMVFGENLEEVGDSDDILHIRDARDLMTFAARCSLNTWSDGVKVALDNDISLSGAAFTPIPYFNGSFNGNGYTIFDVAIEDAQSPCGLFLETGKDAMIYDLNVDGAVLTQGDDSQVGGIVGKNAGMLSNCSFNGQVAAVDQVGGIAGKNEATGLITACRSAGTVSGLGNTGGIAGLNEGTLFACENNSYVNTESVDPSLRLDAIDTSSILNFLRSLTTDNAGVTTDIGGVVGNNKGFVEHCINNATVGYQHLGYNVGGIAGRSSGYLNSCTNFGEVYGRKDAGGIVGQAEPFIEVEAAQNLLDSLSYRMDALNQSINNAIADANGLSSDLVSDLSGLPNFMAPIRNAFSSLDFSQLPDLTQPIELPDFSSEDWPEQIPDQLPDQFQGQVIDQLPDTLDALRMAMEDTVFGMSNEIQRIAGNIDGNSGVLEGDLQDISDNLNALSGTVMQTVYILSSEESYESILTDASGSSVADTIILGKANACINEGTVSGDSDVGGIAGAISLENELDPESDLTSSGNSLIQNRYSFHAVLVQCVNRGEAEAKRECAGGICGRADLGYITNCAAYGSISLEDGSYAGGICGLCYGTIQNSCAKCSLSGNKYVGGIVGNGYTGKGEGENSSTVSGCFSLVEIADRPQYAGAISGGSEGNFYGNYFVQSGFAGIDRLSVHGYAEPISFETFSGVEGIPEECKHFTLRFVVDGETVKTVPFEYGASFDRSVFPEVAKKDGAYAVWDRTDLTDLRFDTVVTAEYRMHETVLRSELNRADGRALIYVDGEFQEGDSLTTTVLPVEEADTEYFQSSWSEIFREQLRSIFQEHKPDWSVCVGVAEKLELVFPDDGLKEHTVRYLTGYEDQNDFRIYRRTDSGWEELEKDSFGSYTRFTVPGTSAEIALVETIQSWWILVFLIEGLLLIPALIWILVLFIRGMKQRHNAQRTGELKRHRKGARRHWVRAHRKPLIIGVAAVLTATLVTVGVTRHTSITTSLETYRLLKQFVREETDILAEVRTESGDKKNEVSTTIQRVQQDGHMISCVQQYGITLYVHDGIAYLDNGRAFSIGLNRLDQGAILNLVLKLFQSNRIEKSQGDEGNTYEIDIHGDQARQIVSILLGNSTEALLGVGQLDNVTVRMTEADGKLTELAFASEHTEPDGTAFVLDADLKPQAMTERPAIPNAVLTAISDGKTEAEAFSDDFLILLSAWVRNEMSETVDGKIALDAECGVLNLNSDYDYFRKKVDGGTVSCVGNNLFTVYFTDSAACTSKGVNLSSAENRLLDVAQLVPVAKELCMKGNFDCLTAGEQKEFTILLDAGEAENIAVQLVPDLENLQITYEDCRIRIILRNNQLSGIELHCGGSLRMVAHDLETHLDVKLQYTEAKEHQIPFYVRQSLGLPAA